MILPSGLRPRASSLASSLGLGALALTLAACGDNGGGTVSASATGSSGSTGDASSTGTNTNPTTSGSTTVDEPTAGSNSISGSSGTDSTTDPTVTATGTSTSTGPDPTTGPNTDTGTTNPVQTDTDPDTTDSTTGSTSTTTGDDTTGSTGSTTDDDTTEGVEPCLCPDLEVPLDDGIFVLSDNSELYKFFPETNQFQDLGTFNCGGMTNTFSMAVDRLGFAWVMFNTPQGEIWKLDVTNVANCEDPGYNQGQMGINYFGMAFVSNSKFDQCDQLYGNTFDGFGGFSEGPGFGDFLTLDPKTLQIQTLGPTTFNGAELTGTGDGRAFMFGGANPAKLVEVDKKNGAYLEVTPLGGLELTNAFAFAFFAGDFYMFTESDNNANFSKVTHYDYDGNKQLTTVVNQAPIRIVGAGVSTCAPFVPM
jgi:hypothetical protein